MAGPFRFAPPSPGAATLTRPRLQRVLQERWAHRVTLVTGGAGMGKTTLLAQALAENELLTTGRDVWLALEPSDVDGHFAADLMARLRPGSTGRTATADAVADAIWQLAPAAVCLMLDDGHLLAPGTAGHELLGDLIRALPANGHLLVAARQDPQLPVARLAVAHELLRLREADLAFDQEELDRIAAERGVDPGVLSAAGGWPAMVELAASARHGVEREFLWQEVIEPLDPTQRRVLATLVELGGGDDALLSAALGEPVLAAPAVGHVPLVAATPDGWYRPHPLWQPMARLRIAPIERAEVLQRAVRHLVASGRLEEAFDLLAHAELWDEAPAVFRASCLEHTRHPPAELLRRWLTTVPEDVRLGPAGQLGAGVLATLEAPDHATDALRSAVLGFREMDDVDGELGALAHLGRVGWWAGDLAMLSELLPRIEELATAGHPSAVALRAIASAVLADLQGDDAGILAALAEYRPGVLGPAWEPAVGWFRSAAHHNLGDAAAARATVEAAIATADDPLFRATLEALHTTVLWSLGHFGDLEHAPLPEAAAAPASVGGVVHNLALGAAGLCRRLAHLGDLDLAHKVLVHLRGMPQGDRPIVVARVASAEASVLLGDGDEAAAADALRAALARHGTGSSARRAWRDALAMTYVLLPEVRPAYDQEPFYGTWATARDLARAVVALREGHPQMQTMVAQLSLPSLEIVRALVHHRLAAELAVGLHDAGRPEGAPLLEALRSSGRAHVRDLADRGAASGMAAAAKRALTAVPAHPRHVVSLDVLGPLAMSRDGDRVDDPGLRREKVRLLLAFLVTRRVTTRAEAIAALWPDFDDQAGTNNLRVTLTHLQRALEPWRADGEPGYLLRSEGTELRLATGDHLRIDVDAFDAHLADAERAERDGLPSVALEAYRAAVALWRGDLHGDLLDVTWLDLERERCRYRCATALQRAGQLELARGEPEQADVLGRRALELDPWAEAAHALLVGAALARGDRTAARRALDRAQAALAELGVELGSELRTLARRFTTAP